MEGFQLRNHNQSKERQHLIVPCMIFSDKCIDLGIGNWPWIVELLQYLVEGISEIKVPKLVPYNDQEAMWTAEVIGK